MCNDSSSNEANNDSSENQPEMKMLELLIAKRNFARDRHDDVPLVDADPALSDFFEDEEYERILDLLINKNSTKGRYAGTPLVVPGDSSKSAFYQQIKPGNGGVMDGRFTEQQAQTVKEWIESL